MNKLVNIYTMELLKYINLGVKSLKYCTRLVIDYFKNVLLLIIAMSPILIAITICY